MIGYFWFALTRSGGELCTTWQFLFIENKRRKYLGTKMHQFFGLVQISRFCKISELLNLILISVCWKAKGAFHYSQFCVCRERHRPSIWTVTILLSAPPELCRVASFGQSWYSFQHFQFLHLIFRYATAPMCPMWQTWSVICIQLQDVQYSIVFKYRTV